MQTLTRGPLPARVYWTRRLLLLATAFAVVFGLAHLFGGSSDATSKPQARQAAAQTRATGEATPSEDATLPAPTVGPTQPATQPGSKQDQKLTIHRPPPLPDPEGDCADEDIAVTPTVHHPVAGGQVTFVMKLRTIEATACTWHVSPDSMTVKVTSGEDDIWFSRVCTKSIPREDVVVRNSHNTKVDVVWSGRRSDDECSRLTDWAMPGYYHVSAAAYAGEPSDTQFKLEKPDAPIVTETVKPHSKQDEKSGQKSDQKSGAKTDTKADSKTDAKSDTKSGQKKQDKSQKRD
jgi:hypothetical protein